MPAAPIAHAAPHLSPSLIVALMLGTLAVLAWWFREPDTPRSVNLLTSAMVAGLSFQVFHGAEHLIQAGAWIARPTAPPYLTPWATWGVDALAVTDGVTKTGAELLHLVGNMLFLAGIVAAYLLFRHRRVPHGELRAFRGAFWVQGFHVFEHVLLVSTWLGVGRALGFSTGFGIFEGDAVVAGAFRVWVHFSINAAATILAVTGVVRAAKWSYPKRQSRPRPRVPAGSS